ncbi:tRNA lysidine(34) synthetase TilS [Thalassorhabdomicrobium marinisediminis]|uniref:tRNA lysidine(34) synthetase TilS n=1 Tax=Thalassorhabdomicrobium marinisediminis TaxID=2170577 RepID=UPI002491A8BA|nr:tRNA lysidine(34) synthetase TilS [Thalassorhabdomicrobium marinisediminis]
MRLTPKKLSGEGDDAGLIHFIDTAFASRSAPERVGVAVSGGGDSMALLHLAWRWARLADVKIEAVTVDHGLRPAAADEAQMVAAYCRTLHVPHTTLKWDGTTATGNLAAAGRNARYRLIGAWAAERAITGVLLGHTVDDIAETFLMRLARKSGVDGLSMMDVNFEREGIRWARPLWQQERADLRDYLRRHEVDWVDDPTNEDDTYDRPKARKALDVLAPLGITRDALKVVAMNMMTARSALDHYAEVESRRLVRFEGGDVIIKTRSVPPVPQEIERRLLVAALRFVGGGAYAPRSDALLELDIALMQGKSHTLAGCLVTRDRHETRIAREFNAVKDHEVALGHVWDNRWQILGTPATKATVRALGAAITQVPDWRETGLPRASLMASPAVFRGDWLISAPVAGLKNGFDARIVADYASFLLSR